MNQDDSKLLWEAYVKEEHGDMQDDKHLGAMNQDGSHDNRVWDSQGKSLQVGDIVHHANEDGQWIVISVTAGHREDQGPGQIQLAEVGEGIVANAKDVAKI